MITVKNISKVIGANAVFSNLSLHVDRGEFVIITNKNSLVVSSVLNCICGSCKADSGSITVNNHPITSLKGGALRKYRQSIGFISSLSQINSRDTVYDNVSLPLLCSAFSKDDLPLKIHKALSYAGIENYIQNRCGKLSDAMKIKVMISRAVALEVELLVVDDIFDSLLPHEKSSITQCLKQISQKLNITVVLGLNSSNFELFGDNKILNLESASQLNEETLAKTSAKNEDNNLPVTLCIENIISGSENDFPQSDSLVYQFGAVLKIPFTILFGNVYFEDGKLKEKFELQIERKFISTVMDYLKRNKISYKKKKLPASCLAASI